MALSFYNPLCQYRYIFGKPREGVHRHRLFGLAFYDLLFTFLAACLISFFFRIHILISFIGLFVVGVFFHLLFCLDSAFVLFLKSFFR